MAVLVSSVLCALRYIDVSVWDPEPIDWHKVAANKVHGVMIRSGYGSSNPKQVDKQFKGHIKGARAAGLPVGIYHYSYAHSVAGARNEADFCLSIIKPYKKQISLPVAYDLEEQSIAELGKKTVTAMAIAFCNKIKAAGYKPMLYCNLNWARNYVDMNKIRASGIDFWIAQYNSKCTYTGHYDMWQYSESVSIPGIKNKVDCSWVYKEYNGANGVIEDAIEGAGSWLEEKLDDLKSDWIRAAERLVNLAETGKVTNALLKALHEIEIGVQDAGAYVKLIQTALKREFPELWNGIVDGVASAELMEAIHAFQKKVGQAIGNFKGFDWDLLLKGKK